MEEFMTKILLFMGVIAIAIAGLIFNDVSTLRGYAQQVGSVLGYGSGYTQVSVNAVQDSVKSAASAVDDIRENKAKAIIEEQRKKIEEMRKELEQAMNTSENKAKEKN